MLRVSTLMLFILLLLLLLLLLFAGALATRSYGTNPIEYRKSFCSGCPIIYLDNKFSFGPESPQRIWWTVVSYSICNFEVQAGIILACRCNYHRLT